MPEDRTTSSCPLASTIEPQQQLEHTPPTTPTSTKAKRQRRQSTSTNGTITDTKPTSSRRRSATTTKATTAGSNVGSSRATQRSTASPSDMSSISLTKTGRVSKAKKGLKVHDCECGRSYTRAEHLRRHQRNHAQERALVCKYANCGKAFFRSDLLQRHEERHNELGNASRQSSVSSTEQSVYASPTTAPAPLPVVTASIISPTVAYSQPHALVSSQPEVTPFPRYNPNLFRAPQLPRTPKIGPFNLSNPVFHSSHDLKRHTNDMKHNTGYPTRHSISGPVPVEGMTTGGLWHDSYAPSPYSCSSGYASPAPGPEYNHMYATPPYSSGLVRTRASSNASVIEQTWVHASQSPTSSISMPYSWPSGEKNIMASSFPFMPVSYATSNMPMHASFDTMAQYPQYDPHNVVQMDNEEGLQLFPENHYGMSQIMRAYPIEQWLNNYWRLFHPAFPIVHRFTFASRDLSPMLYAAMIAIDLQYSNDAGQRQRAWELHKCCTRLLLQREQLNRTGCDRLCDSQAIFLVEVFAQYCAQRCPKTLTSRFELMYEKVLQHGPISCDSSLTSLKLAGIRTISPSTIFGLQLLAPEDNVNDRWIQWAKLSARQHLLLSCFVLESQQSTLIARDRELSLHTMSDVLPFPVCDSLWGATTASEWISVAREQSNMPLTVHEAVQLPTGEHYNVFQSAVLIAAYKEYADGSAASLSTISKHLSQSSTTQLQLLTTKLTQILPMRTLLAVSGESYVLGTKATSTAEEFSVLRSTLSVWIGQVWSSTVSDELNPATEALSLSVAILKLSLETNKPLALGLGHELGLFFAALVLWAATAAATSRVVLSRLSTQHSHIATTSHSGIHFDTDACHPTDIQPLISSDRRASFPCTEIFSNASHFLSTAIDDIFSFEIAACQIGCKSLLLWVKMHLRGAFSNDAEPEEVGINSIGDRRGELVTHAIGQIERMLDHRWETWGI
ncbi:hypothetical protein C7974DRAFT_338811 [Boeremia exigua]|uniref:uncharacterized protein n=1 Tax=Boeremia exigua TaxID=749465 RepID=UPI001E8EECA1|nr:uncharacterized protein C7974DRAFT_338811 [Boeremia exigua]KAH6621959.1 hypothetical protein C7974DRAFT_338811 [Boeremia exigua]